MKRPVSRKREESAGKKALRRIAEQTNVARFGIDKEIRRAFEQARKAGK